MNLQAKLGLAQQLAAKLSGGVTNVVMMEGLLPASAMRDEEERREVRLAHMIRSSHSDVISMCHFHLVVGRTILFRMCTIWCSDCQDCDMAAD